MLRKAFLAACVVATPALANAASIISDGNVSLGVDDLGQLNIGGGVADIAGETTVGTRWIDPDTDIQYESTSHGCLCEGWGLAVDGTAGYANNSTGTGGLSLISFDSTATTAESVVQITGTDVTVTHSYQLSASDDLYEAIVTIENTGSTDVSSLEYRRTMDWDTSPTPFDEYVTIGGTATTTLLDESSNNGFSSSNPLTNDNNSFGVSCAVDDTDFSACGPYDHGAVFDFLLGSLGAGETYSFSIFYGGAANEADADAALGIVGAELYSYGWSGDDADQDGFGDGSGDVTPTFIFAFKGVGGTVVVPPPTPGPSPDPIPLPAGAWLMLGGLGALAAVRRKKSTAA